MRSSIFLVVPLAAVALGQATNSGASQSPVATVINTSPPSVSPRSSSSVVITSGTVISTATTGSIKLITTATTATNGTQTSTKTTSTGGTNSGASSSTRASTTPSTGAAAEMMQPIFSLGLAGVIFAALF